MKSQSNMISILICTHNRCDSLGKTLDSVERLNPAEGHAREILVVDNASRDRTRDVVEGFARSSSIPVRYILEERLGKSHALNTGIGQCDGSIIAFTDDDAIVAPDWLDQISRAFEESHPGMVFGRVDPLWETAPPTWFTRKDHGRFALLDYGPERFVVEDVEHAFYGVNLAIRREVLDSLGGFRTDRGPCGVRGGAGEDTDLFERALASGIRIVYDPHVVAEHFIPSVRCSKAYHRERAKNGSEDYYLFVRESEKCLPQLAGLPRYRYRLAATTLLRYLKDTITRRDSERFHSELELRRFFGLLVHSLGRGRLGAR